MLLTVDLTAAGIKISRVTSFLYVLQFRLLSNNKQLITLTVPKNSSWLPTCCNASTKTISVPSRRCPKSQGHSSKSGAACVQYSEIGLKDLGVNKFNHDFFINHSQVQLLHRLGAFTRSFGNCSLAHSGVRGVRHIWLLQVLSVKLVAHFKHVSRGWCAHHLWNIHPLSHEAQIPAIYCRASKTLPLGLQNYCGSRKTAQDL